MMNCPNCHNPISENQSVCYSCGARLDGASDVPPETVPDGLTAQPQADLSESMHTEQPQTEPPQPPKKSKLPVVILIAAAAVLLIAAGTFVGIKLFGSQGIGGTERSATASASVTEGSPEPSRTLPELVEAYEEGLNNNDKDALTALFAPSLRDKKKVETAAITFFNNLIGQAGQKLTYDFELLDDIDYSGDDQATGTVKISAELPVVGLQSTQTKFSFLMEDGEWYISGVDIV